MFGGNCLNYVQRLRAVMRNIRMHVQKHVCIQPKTEHIRTIVKKFSTTATTTTIAAAAEGKYCRLEQGI
jgi:hypothetical protein